MERQPSDTIRSVDFVVMAKENGSTAALSLVVLSQPYFVQDGNIVPLVQQMIDNGQITPGAEVYGKFQAVEEKTADADKQAVLDLVQKGICNKCPANCNGFGTQNSPFQATLHLNERRNLGQLKLPCHPYTSRPVFGTIKFPIPHK